MVLHVYVSIFGGKSVLCMATDEERTGVHADTYGGRMKGQI